MANSGSELKKIPIDSVTIGMYVEDVVDSDNKLLISTHEAIRNDNQINRIRKRGVQYVYINLTKGANSDPESTATESAISNISPANEASRRREIAYYKELEGAKEAHSSAIATSRSIMNTIKAGHLPEAKVVLAAAEEMVSSIDRNSEALISLTQLKDYDDYTFTHSVNVGILTAATAKQMGYSSDEAAFAGMGGLLHDIGKMKISEALLNKQGKLSEAEYSMLKRHAVFGIEMVNSMRGIPDIAKKVVLQHHERINGKGYPFGVKAERIHEMGLVAGAIDVYDALTSERVYKSAWTPQKALAILFKGIDSEFSRDIVEIFTRQMGIYPVGSFVKLKSGAMGVVVHVDQGSLLTPKIALVIDENGKRIATSTIVDLFREQRLDGGDKFKIEVSLNPAAYNIKLADYIGHRL